MYDHKTEKGGRPNIDEIIMIKILILQEWHGLSDPELERRSLIGYPFVSSWVSLKPYQITQPYGFLENV